MWRVVVPCLLSCLVSKNDAVRVAAVQALHSVLKLYAECDDVTARLLGRITRRKSHAGISAASSYACQVSTLSVGFISISSSSSSSVIISTAPTTRRTHALQGLQ